MCLLLALQGAGSISFSSAHSPTYFIFAPFPTTLPPPQPAVELAHLRPTCLSSFFYRQSLDAFTPCVIHSFIVSVDRLTHQVHWDFTFWPVRPQRTGRHLRDHQKKIHTICPFSHRALFTPLKGPILLFVILVRRNGIPSSASSPEPP